MSKQVIVIGAGIAGLSAAHHLQRHGCTVTVLEAQDRVGGRMSTDLREGYCIDRGAQFLSTGYAVIGDLIAQLGLAGDLERTSQYSGTVRAGRVRVVEHGKPWTYVSSGLLRWGDLLRLGFVSSRAARRNRHLPLNDYAAWHDWDEEPTSAWIMRHAGSDALEYLFEPMLAGFYFQDPESTSIALSMMVASFGQRGCKTVALRSGMGSLTEALARGLDVRLSSGALALAVDATGVSVETIAETLRADHVVLATTASTARALYHPECMATRDVLACGYSSTINIGIALPAGIASSTVAKNVYGLLIPRCERSVIAAVGIETRKMRDAAPRGELLNVMLNGGAGARLIDASEEAVLAEVLPELEQYFPGTTQQMAFAHFCRWREAEPRSPVGRGQAVRAYRAVCSPGQKIVLAGDYLSAPTTEGAAHSGRWAARLIMAAP